MRWVFFRDAEHDGGALRRHEHRPTELQHPLVDDLDVPRHEQRGVAVPERLSLSSTDCVEVDIERELHRSVTDDDGAERELSIVLGGEEHVAKLDHGPPVAREIDAEVPFMPGRAVDGLSFFGRPVAGDAAAVDLMNVEGRDA